MISGAEHVPAMIAAALLAPAQPEPARPGRVDLVLPGDVAGAPEVSVPFASILALVAAVALMVAALWVWRRVRPADPGEAAFQSIAGALRLSRAERLLLRELAAAHGGATPTALLLSEHALNEAVRAAQGIEDPIRIERLVKKIDESTRKLAA